MSSVCVASLGADVRFKNKRFLIFSVLLFNFCTEEASQSSSGVCDITRSVEEAEIWQQLFDREVSTTCNFQLGLYGACSQSASYQVRISSLHRRAYWLRDWNPNWNPPTFRFQENSIELWISGSETRRDAVSYLDPTTILLFHPHTGTVWTFLIRSEDQLLHNCDSTERPPRLVLFINKTSFPGPIISAQLKLSTSTSLDSISDNTVHDWAETSTEGTKKGVGSQTLRFREKWVWSMGAHTNLCRQQDNMAYTTSWQHFAQQILLDQRDYDPPENTMTFIGKKCMLECFP